MRLRHVLLALSILSGAEGLLGSPALAQTAAPDAPDAPLSAEPPSGPPPAAQVTADESGFQLKSADGAFALRLRGDAQTDGRFFVGDADGLGVDQILLRRARLILQGTLGGRYDFRLLPNFGQGRLVLEEAYVDARFGPAFALQAGKTKVPFGLEWLRSSSDLTLVERGLPSALVPNYDVGVMAHGAVVGGRVGYELGVFNGALDGQSADGDAHDGKDVAARLFAQPFRGTGGPLAGLGLGFAVTLGRDTGEAAAPALASYRTSGGRLFGRFLTGTTDSTAVLADGRRLRYSPQASLYAGPAALLTEVVVSEQAVRLGGVAADLTATAFQATGSYVLTGEPATNGRVRPAHPLGRDGGLGALEVAARYGVLRLDEDAFPTFASPTASAREARAWTLGLNWYPTANVKVMANVERTTFGLAAAPEGTPAFPAETLVLTRFQVAF